VETLLGEEASSDVEDLLAPGHRLRLAPVNPERPKEWGQHHCGG
jgi:hypothetical protein